MAWHASAPHTPTEEATHYGAIDERMAHDRRSRRILTALYWDIAPDAVVIINEYIHRGRVQTRSDLTWGEVQTVTAAMRETARKYKVPIFDSFDRARAYTQASRCNLC